VRPPRRRAGRRAVKAGAHPSDRSTAVRHGPGITASVRRPVETITAAASILATFVCRLESRAAWRVHHARAAGQRAPPLHTRDGLRIAEHGGPSTDNLPEGWWIPMLSIPGEYVARRAFYRSPSSAARRPPPQIMVTGRGRRFVNERGPTSEIGRR